MTQKKKEEWEIDLENHVLNFNNTLASVLIGGKHRIMRTVSGEATYDGRIAYEFFRRQDLSMVYDNTAIKIGEKRDAKGILKDVFANHLMAWAKHFQSRSFTGGIVFLPGHKAQPTYFNTWQDYSVKPKQDTQLLSLIYSHITDVVCAGNNELANYLLNWIAYTFQNPDKPAGSAIVFRGEKGSGKGTLGHFLRKIWGNHGLHISNAKHLVGNFNAHLADVCFLFADEAFFSGDKQHEGVLKAMITEPTVICERKGIDAIQQPNYLKILMATNADYAVPATRDERRYCVMDVSKKRIGDRQYFDTLHLACNSEAVQSAFLYAMLYRNLTGFHTGDIPDSVGLRDQRYHSMKSYQRWFVDALVKGSFYLDGDNWMDEVASEKLFTQYIHWCDAAKTGEYRRVTQSEFCKYFAKIYTSVKRVKSDKKRGFNFGSLNNAISLFEAYEKIKISEFSM